MTGFDADVIVVGCGPVGVMVALRCAQRGLSVIVIDKDTEVYPLPRAIGMDDEIQQLVARAGLGEELASFSSTMGGGEFVNTAGERVVGIELPEGTVGPLGFPPMVAFDQPSFERSLRRAAIAAGADMRLGLEAEAIDNTADGVRLRLRDGALDVSLAARWLIGADGAKSTIRSLLGIEMIDQGFDQTWLVVDVTLLDPDLDLPRLARQHCDPARITTLVPGFGTRRRWEFQLQPGESRDEMLTEDAIARLLSRWGTPAQLQVDRAAVYRFHATVAERFRQGSVFLAGDAAHQMPPFNGQGMCSGVRDAENLAWKLAQIGSGATDSILDTYDAERRPHATAQVVHAVDAGLLIEAIAHDGEAALESGYGQRPFPNLEHGLIDGDHRAVGRPLPEPTTGEGPTGDGWHLIRSEVTDPVPGMWRQLGAQVHDVSAGAYPGLIEPGVTVVVRPDRYIAAVTGDLAVTTQLLAPTLE
jgi:3-(3-hydroxy-phenyl)propionate hydroxylase